MATVQEIDTAAGCFMVHITGAGPPLLYLHGLLGSGEKARASSPPGYEVATYDQRGHGDSPRTWESSEFGIDRFVGDALSIMDALGWHHCAVGGESMGAAVALRLTLDHPARVDQLILTAPAFGATVNAEAQNLGALADALEESTDVDETIASIRSNMQAEGMPEEASAFFESLRIHDLKVLAQAIRRVMKWAPFPDLDAAADLDMAAVVLSWPDDALHPWDLAERMAELLSAPLGQIDNVFTALADRSAISRALGDLLKGSTADD